MQNLIRTTRLPSRERKFANPLQITLAQNIICYYSSKNVKARLSKKNSLKNTSKGDASTTFCTTKNKSILTQSRNTTDCNKIEHRMNLAASTSRSKNIIESILKTFPVKPPIKKKKPVLKVHKKLTAECSLRETTILNSSKNKHISGISEKQGREKTGLQAEKSGNGTGSQQQVTAKSVQRHKRSDHQQYQTDHNLTNSPRFKSLRKPRHEVDYHIKKLAQKYSKPTKTSDSLVKGAGTKKVKVLEAEVEKIKKSEDKQKIIFLEKKKRMVMKIMKEVRNFNSQKIIPPVKENTHPIKPPNEVGTRVSTSTTYPNHKFQRNSAKLSPQVTLNNLQYKIEIMENEIGKKITEDSKNLPKKSLVNSYSEKLKTTYQPTSVGKESGLKCSEPSTGNFVTSGHIFTEPNCDKNTIGTENNKEGDSKKQCREQEKSNNANYSLERLNVTKMDQKQLFVQQTKPSQFVEREEIKNPDFDIKNAYKHDHFMVNYNISKKENLKEKEDNMQVSRPASEKIKIRECTHLAVVSKTNFALNKDMCSLQNPRMVKNTNAEINQINCNNLGAQLIKHENQKSYKGQTIFEKPNPIERMNAINVMKFQEENSIIPIIPQNTINEFDLKVLNTNRTCKFLDLIFSRKNIKPIRIPQSDLMIYTPFDTDIIKRMQSYIKELRPQFAKDYPKCRLQNALFFSLFKDVHLMAKDLKLSVEEVLARIESLYRIQYFPSTNYHFILQTNIPYKNTPIIVNENQSNVEANQTRYRPALTDEDYSKRDALRIRAHQNNEISLRKHLLKTNIWQNDLSKRAENGDLQSKEEISVKEKGTVKELNHAPHSMQAYHNSDTNLTRISVTGSKTRSKFCYLDTAINEGNKKNQTMQLDAIGVENKGSDSNKLTKSGNPLDEKNVSTQVKDKKFSSFKQIAELNRRVFSPKKENKKQEIEFNIMSTGKEVTASQNQCMHYCTINKCHSSYEDDPIQKYVKKLTTNSQRNRNVGNRFSDQEDAYERTDTMVNQLKPSKYNSEDMKSSSFKNYVRQYIQKNINANMDLKFKKANSFEEITKFIENENINMLKPMESTNLEFENRSKDFLTMTNNYNEPQENSIKSSTNCGISEKIALDATKGDIAWYNKQFESIDVKLCAGTRNNIKNKYREIKRSVSDTRTKAIKCYQETGKSNFGVERKGEEEIDKICEVRMNAGLHESEKADIAHNKGDFPKIPTTNQNVSKGIFEDLTKNTESETLESMPEDKRSDAFEMANKNIDIDSLEGQNLKDHQQKHVSPIEDVYKLFGGNSKLGDGDKQISDTADQSYSTINEQISTNTQDRNVNAQQKKTMFDNTNLEQQKNRERTGLVRALINRIEEKQSNMPLNIDSVSKNMANSNDLISKSDIKSSIIDKINEKESNVFRWNVPAERGNLAIGHSGNMTIKEGEIKDIPKLDDTSYKIKIDNNKSTTISNRIQNQILAESNIKINNPQERNDTWTQITDLRTINNKRRIAETYSKIHDNNKNLANREKSLPFQLIEKEMFPSDQIHITHLNENNCRRTNITDADKAVENLNKHMLCHIMLPSMYDQRCMTNFEKLNANSIGKSSDKRNGRGDSNDSMGYENEKTSRKDQEIPEEKTMNTTNNQPRTTIRKVIDEKQTYVTHLIKNKILSRSNLSEISKETQQIRTKSIKQSKDSLQRLLSAPSFSRGSMSSMYSSSNLVVNKKSNTDINHLSKHIRKTLSTVSVSKNSAVPVAQFSLNGTSSEVLSENKPAPAVRNKSQIFAAASDQDNSTNGVNNNNNKIENTAGNITDNYPRLNFSQSNKTGDNVQTLTQKKLSQRDSLPRYKTLNVLSKGKKVNKNSTKFTSVVDNVMKTVKAKLQDLPSSMERVMIYPQTRGNRIIITKLDDESSSLSRGQHTVRRKSLSNRNLFQSSPDETNGKYSRSYRSTRPSKYSVLNKKKNRNVMQRCENSLILYENANPHQSYSDLLNKLYSKYINKE